MDGTWTTVNLKHCCPNYKAVVIRSCGMGTGIDKYTFGRIEDLKLT